jgi:hypothetical protein
LFQATGGGSGPVGGYYLLSDNGGFGVGERGCVYGALRIPCFSICMEGDGCIDVATIEADCASDVCALAQRDALTPTPTSNRPPLLADAAVFPNPARSGQEVTLDASGSSGARIDGYAWVQIEGPAVQLVGADTVRAMFEAPSVTEPTTLRFELTVYGWGGSPPSSEISRWVDVQVLPALTATPTNTPTPPEMTPTKTPTITCIAEWAWLSRDLPSEGVAGTPFTISYRAEGASAGIRRVEETLPSGWQVLSPPWDEHQDDSYAWNRPIQSCEVLPPADLLGGDYYFYGSTVSWHWCNGEVTHSISGDSVMHISAGTTPTPTETPTLTVTPTPDCTGCPGDCNGNGQVIVNELVLAVNIALGERPVDACRPVDCNADGQARVDELVRAVQSALIGCPTVP